MCVNKYIYVFLFLFACVNIDLHVCAQYYSNTAGFNNIDPLGANPSVRTQSVQPAQNIQSVPTYMPLISPKQPAQPQNKIFRISNNVGSWIQDKIKNNDNTSEHDMASLQIKVGEAKLKVLKMKKKLEEAQQDYDEAKREADSLQAQFDVLKNQN